jgi:hypothetical protein
MPSIEHRFGTCDVIACVRLRGDQPHRVRGVAAVASQTGDAHLSVRVAGILVYFEDRAAWEAYLRAVHQAEQLVEEVFGAERCPVEWPGCLQPGAARPLGCPQIVSGGAPSLAGA